MMDFLASYWWAMLLPALVTSLILSIAVAGNNKHPESLFWILVQLLGYIVGLLIVIFGFVAGGIGLLLAIIRFAVETAN